MKKLALLMAILLIATMAVTFVGCGNNEDSNEDGGLYGTFEVDNGVTLSFNNGTATMEVDLLDLLTEADMTEVTDFLGLQAGSIFAMTLTYTIDDDIVTLTFTENDIDNLIGSIIDMVEGFAETVVENAIDVLTPLLTEIAQVAVEFIAEADLTAMIAEITAAIDEAIFEVEAMEFDEFVLIAEELLEGIEYFIELYAVIFAEIPMADTIDFEDLLETILSIDVIELAEILEYVANEVIIVLDNFVVDFEEIAIDFIENTLEELLVMIDLLGTDFAVDMVVGMVEGMLSAIDFSEIIGEVVAELENSPELRAMLIETLVEQIGDEGFVLTLDVENGTLTDENGFVIARR